MTEATDEDIVQIKRACEYWKLDFRCDEAGEIMVEMLPKLLARLERVERELRVMQCGAQEARSLNKQPG